MLPPTSHKAHSGIAYLFTPPMKAGIFSIQNIKLVVVVTPVDIVENT